MPSLNQISSDINSADHRIRGQYIDEYARHTGRNVICYYSNFLSIASSKTAITDVDMQGFMSAVQDLDKGKDLDLFLHTPGGHAPAAESIVVYLREVFADKNMRVIVPHMAMSAGTMLACASDEIVMGKHSSLGPIDPQFGGIPAWDIVREHNNAKREIQADHKTAPYWHIVLEKYPSGIYERCVKEIALSTILAKSWLKKYHLQDTSLEEIEKIVKKLNDNEESLTHSRHFSIEKCKNFGLNVKSLEQDQKLQDLALTIHHCFLHLFTQKPFYKLIHSNNHNLWGILDKK